VKDVTTYYLEMNSPDELNGKSKPEGFEVIEAEVKNYRLNRFLYQLVGEPWQWKDKLAFSDSEWQQYAESPDLRMWFALSKGSIAGYFELQRHEDDSIEIAYFGLAPDFLGQGFGGYFLTHAIQSAWEWDNPKRVWVHSCTLDHEYALANYQARGLSVYKTIRSR
jgi:GNAT superfamily N-acetyltransferase